MNKFRKAISVGLTATMLASLLATAVAPSVFAAAGSTSVTGPVSIGPGATSAAAITINFTEGTTAAPNYRYPAGGFTATIQLFDANGDSEIGFSGTPALSGGPGSLVGTSGFPSLGTSGLGVANDQLLLSFDLTDTSGSEPFSITGLKIKSSSDAGAGAIRMIVVASSFGVCTTPADIGCSLWGNGNLTISAETESDVLAGATAVPFTAGDPTIAFAPSGAVTVGGIAGSNGLLVIDDGASTESVGIVTGAGPGSGTLTTNALGFGHPAATGISQNVVVAGLLASPGAVVNGLILNTTFGGEFDASSVQPGENNQGIGGLDVTENAFGTLKVGTVVTFTLAPAGVKFSTPPLLHLHNGLNLGNGVNTNTACSLSFDRTSCSVTVTAKTTTLGGPIPAIVLSTSESSQALIDIDSTVPQGTSITIGVTTSPVLPVKVTDNVVATVSRVIIGVGATPTIYINENDQQSGMLTLSESVAGQFKDASDVLGQNWFGLCQLSGETYTRAPFAVVTVGDLKLRDGAAAATSVKGTLFTYSSYSCVKWQVWTKSTVASTIEIRGSDAAGVVLPSGATNGPRLSVPGWTAPGPTLTQVNVGTEAEVNSNQVKQTIATNAVRAFRNQPVVAAVNQTVIARGSTRAALGNITITETQAGQFKANETVELCILDMATPAGSLDVVSYREDNTADNPIVATNTSTGLLAHVISSTIGGQCFTLTIVQQATGALGVITISNMWVSVLGDAPNGNVLVEVTTDIAGVKISRVVTPARIGNVVAGTATSRLGVTQLGAFTTSTKVAKVTKYVTFRFDFGVAAAGQRVEIWGATKTGNDWTGFAKVTARIANASGVVYYHIRQSSATWKSYRALWAGAGAYTPARQARWIP